MEIFKKIILILFLVGYIQAGFPEKYYEIKNISKQKKEFINILKPLIEKTNRTVLKERAFVKSFSAKAITSSLRHMKMNDLKYLLKIFKKYKVNGMFNFKELLRKVDTVPASLAITQGAVESAWGKSRFVQEANNIFGHWTWGENGLIPLHREEGKTHRIRIFRTLQASVNAYVLNLNTHKAYKKFRDLREKEKKAGNLFSGYEAANTMINYSALGIQYTKILHKLMKDNNLLYYDNL